MNSTASISFDFSELDSIRPALLQCTVRNRGQYVTAEHLPPLRRLAAQFKSTRTALENAERLATGYEDLIVIMLEPADREETVSYEDILSGTGSPYTGAVQLLDQTLRIAFNDQRHVDNTIILDSRPLRPRKVRDRENAETRHENDRVAVAVLEEVLASLSPKVIVVCQCDSTGLEAGLPEYLSSSVRDAGKASFLQMQNGHTCVRIPSFHPMFFARTESSPLQRVMREYLFDTTFVVAANALTGRSMSGLGIINLRHCALDGPCFKWTAEGIKVSYQWIGPEDCATPELVALLHQVGLLPDTRLDKSTKLIGTYQSEDAKQVDLGVPNEKLDLKRDPLEDFSHLIPKLPKDSVPW